MSTLGGQFLWAHSSEGSGHGQLHWIALKENGIAFPDKHVYHSKSSWRGLLSRSPARLLLGRRTKAPGTLSTSRHLQARLSVPWKEKQVYFLPADVPSKGNCLSETPLSTHTLVPLMVLFILFICFEIGLYVPQAGFELTLWLRMAVKFWFSLLSCWGWSSRGTPPHAVDITQGLNQSFM